MEKVSKKKSMEKTNIDKLTGSMDPEHITHDILSLCSKQSTIENEPKVMSKHG